MYGAIFGDIVGSPFEFDRGKKSKKFELFSPGAAFTDDTVMTAAVTEALLSAGPDADVDTLRRNTVQAMRRWGRRYPDAGYGISFRDWLASDHPQPYGSYGNGSAMRVSAAGWLYDSLERTRAAARATADVTHNHPEGIKGAEAVASVIYLARNGADKREIRLYVEREFGYRLNRTIAEIRPGYTHVESCQETVPEALTAFLEGTDFEDTVRTAVSLGGDCDTLTAIAASAAEAFYGMPEEFRQEVRRRVTPDIVSVLDRFDAVRGRGKTENPLGNAELETAIERLVNGVFGAEKEARAALLNGIRKGSRMLLPTRMKFDPREWFDPENVRIGDRITNDKPLAFTFCLVHSPRGEVCMAAFTSREEYEKGECADTVFTMDFRDILVRTLRNTESEGLVINPWGSALMLSRNQIADLLEEADEA